MGDMGKLLVEGSGKSAMKRFIIAILLTASVLVLTACNSGGFSQEEYDKLSSEIDELRELLGENNSDSIITEDWEIRYYVDEFNLPTSVAYIINSNPADGTFSNSATTNSNLLAEILVDKYDVCIFLYTYGRSQVKNSSTRNSQSYSITMRTENGNRQEITGSMRASGDRITIDSAYRVRVINALLHGSGSVSFYIVETDRPSTNYLFSVETSNFEEVYWIMER
jgi:hypothetical protein